MGSQDSIDAAITEATGDIFRTRMQRAVGGGCINETYVISDDARCFFVKTNDAAYGEMFAAEAEGLSAIVSAGSVRAPRPICRGSFSRSAYLVLEYLPLGPEHGDSLARLGAGLAALHRHTHPEYGWHRDNTIGTTPQLNRRTRDWAVFWRDCRLQYQLQCAARRGCGASLLNKGERLLSELNIILKDHNPPASLLHGDLWSGNFAVLENGEPIIFDPAVYYGDRETDLAMTELFGGFMPSFYAAYRDHYPLDGGYALRKLLYNLYHVLNHYNLFGGGYAAQAERMIDKLLSEIR